MQRASVARVRSTTTVMLAMVVTIVAMFALSVIAPSPARADDRAEAAREFAAGQAADKRRDWAAAITHYKRANELVPHPYAIYNIAVDYERLGQLRDAAIWFDAYLDAAPSANDRDKVNKKILDLRNRPAKILVRSYPPGATVKIQGLPAGSTPLTTERDGGIYRVVVEKDGERDARDITIEYGEPVEIDVQLRERPGGGPPPVRDPNPIGRPGGGPNPAAGRPALKGVLRVTGIPDGAFVSIDHEPAGNIPLRVPLVAGPHTVRVTAMGYQPFQTVVQVIPDREVTIEARMPRALGGLPPQPKEKKPTYIHYMFGGGGGVDARSDGSVPSFLGEIGIRGGRYDVMTRAGSINGEFAFDIGVRYSLFDARFSPFGGFGYSYVNGGLGWEVLFGFRFDFTRKETYGISLVTEAQLRWFAGRDTSDSEESANLAVPIIAALQILYR